MFHSESDVMPLKEVLKKGAAHMPSGAVESVLFQVRDDDLVHEGKVGVSTYYWSFPGEAGTKKRQALAAAEQNVARQLQQIASLEAQTAEVAQSLDGREGETVRARARPPPSPHAPAEHAHDPADPTSVLRRRSWRPPRRGWRR